MRTIRPDDAVALRAAFHRLSPASRYQRFMGQVADLTPAMLTYLTEVDGVDHVALVAVRLDHEEREHEIVAVARAIRVGTHTAEVALTVADAWQGRGLGRCILQALLAELRGISELVAHALPSNRAIRALLAEHGELTESDALRVQLRRAPTLFELVAAFWGFGRAA